MDTGQYQFYKNAQYRNTRNEKKTLTTDLKSTEVSEEKVKKNLPSP